MAQENDKSTASKLCGYNQEPTLVGKAVWQKTCVALTTQRRKSQLFTKFSLWSLYLLHYIEHFVDKKDPLDDEMDDDVAEPTDPFVVRDR